MIIYKVKNKINGKIYIGQTRKKKYRKYFGSGTKIKCAIKKYGKENFTYKVLRKCENQDQLDFWEEVYIKKFNSTNKKIGYNILPGTSNNFGCGSPMFIPEVAKKVSKSLKLRFRNEIFKERMFSGLRKYHNDPIKKEEFRKIMSKAVQGKKNPNYGNKWSEEQKNDLREKMKGRYNGKDNPNYGNKWNKDQRKNLSNKRSRTIKQISLETGEVINTFPNSVSASKELKISRGSITACACGYNKTAGGFKFEYEK